MRLFVIVLAIAACQRGRDEPAPAPATAPPSDAPAKLDKPAPRPAPPPLPANLPGKRTDVTALVGDAARAAFGARGELVLASPSQLRVVEPGGRELARAPVSAGCHVLRVDGDRILTGWGTSREHLDAQARVAIYRVTDGKLVDETVLAPPTTRAEVVAVLPIGDALFVAYFESKYLVKSVVASKGPSGWTTRDFATLRMATSYAVMPDGDIAVGRIYGDAKGKDGDAFVMSAGGKRTPLPTLRGVRSLAVAGGDVWLGDGWHQNYAAEGHGRLVRVHAGTAELIEDTAGQFAIERILPTTIDGKLVVVTLGSHYVRAFANVGGAWKGLTIAGAARDIAVRGDQVLVVADKSELVSLAGVTW